MADIKSETIALGALFQCCSQVQRIASSGFMDEHAAACVIRGILINNPKSVEDIYLPGRLLTGFKQLSESFSSSAGDKTFETIEVTKTALKLIQLTCAVERNPKVFDHLGSEIDRLAAEFERTQPGFFDSDPAVVLSSGNLKEFSSLYQSLISPHFAKLIIYGEPRHLREVANQERIRSLLLAGLRAVVLWRQVGGRRRFLMFRRKAIINCAKTGVRTGTLN